MAVTIRGTPGTDGAGSTATATSRTPAITSGTLPGELMIAACSWGSSNGTITLSTPPSGWTLLHNTNQTSAELAVYYRYFQAGDANPAFVPRFVTVPPVPPAGRVDSDGAAAAVVGRISMM